MRTHERRQSLSRSNGCAAAVECAIYGLSESISSSERTHPGCRESSRAGCLPHPAPKCQGGRRQIKGNQVDGSSSLRDPNNNGVALPDVGSRKLDHLPAARRLAYPSGDIAEGLLAFVHTAAKLRDRARPSA